MKLIKLLGVIALTGAVSMMSSGVFAKERTHGRGAPGQPVVYVTSQDKFYDSIVLADLPFNDTDNFQLLKPGVGPSGLATEFGPGDTEYFGGRWWVDLNNDGYMDDGDHFFLCPLLGPGRNQI